MRGERVNILLGTDARYAPYYGVMLTSLFMNNKESQFDVYMFTDDTLAEKETKKFNRLVDEYNSQLHVIVVDSSEMKSFPETTHISIPAYYRLRASSLLPKEVHKVLYLDGDIIVNGNIIPLWNTDISNYAFAGVVDTIYYDDEIYYRLSYDKSYRYYNAGVALYNLDYWRKNNVSDNAIQYIEQNRDRIKWMDQDVVNALLFKEIKRLPLRFNFQNKFLLSSEWKHFDRDFCEEVLREMCNPVIIHYCGPDKPWSFRYYHSPYSELYHYYRKKSLWTNAEVRRPFFKYMKFLLKLMIKHRNIDDSVSEKYIQESHGLYKLRN